MKIGLFLTNQHQSNTDMIARLEEQYIMTHHARDNGWDSLFSGQHYLNEGNQQLQLVPFLSRLQAEAGDMTLGLGILLSSLHNPVYMAETIASLDVISRGNFICGIGLGYRDIEFDAFGVIRGQRVKRFEESLNLIKRLWTEENVSFRSNYCNLNNVTMQLKPIQKPYPPIWIAANNDNAVRRAARLSDAWLINPHATSETVIQQMKLFTQERNKANLPPPKEIPAFREIFCAKDRSAAIKIAGHFISEKYAAYSAWGQDKVMPTEENFAQPFDNLLIDRFVLGSPEECFEQLKPLWEQCGVNHFIFRTHWAGMPLETSLQSMQLISDGLIPLLNQIPHNT